MVEVILLSFPKSHLGFLMKRLLLILILFPFSVSAQTRRKDVIEPNIDVAANLRSLSESMANNKCVKAADIRIIDDGGAYPTTVIFHHLINPSDSVLNEDDNAHAIAGLPVYSVAEIHTEDIPVSTAETDIYIPRLPVVQVETISRIATFATVKIPAEDIPFRKAEIIASLPHLPVVQEEPIAALPSVSVVKFHTDDILFTKAEIATALLPLPIVREETIATLPALSAVKFHTEHTPFSIREITITLTKIEVDRKPATEMSLSDEGYSLLEKLEGYSPDLYSLNDGGYTIGFGFFVPYTEGAKWRKGITIEEAERLIQQKVPAYEDQVKQYVNVPLTQSEFDALTMLAYNLGGFSKATSIINDINNQADFDKIQSDWKRFVHSKAPNVSKGLMNRRKDELKVKETSNYQPNRKIQVLKK
jgi:GH24 family phage-related lysozyme (muramidase)